MDLGPLMAQEIPKLNVVDVSVGTTRVKGYVTVAAFELLAAAGWGGPTSQCLRLVRHLRRSACRQWQGAVC